MMKLNLKYSFLLVVFLLFAFHGKSSRIDRGYEALYIYDYFKAKKLFTKALKYNKAAAAQGLAVIFYRNDNPFHSNDSALAYINLAHQEFFQTKLKKRDLYAGYGFTEDSINKIRQSISQRFFEESKEKGNVSSLGAFIDEHTWYNNRGRAIEIRDSLAFFNAVGSNTSDSYKQYLEAYPQSEFTALAQDNYYNTLYEEVTEDGSLTSFENFLQAYPQNPMAVSAEEEVYRIVTSPNTIEAFHTFVSDYPKNHLNEKGWKELYQLYLKDYSIDRIENFLNEYSEAPINELVKLDLRLCDSLFLPFNKEEKYGYMNEAGEMLIQNDFLYTGFFKEGMAIVQTEKGVGFISKQGVLQITPEYDVAIEFENGLAIVEKNDRLGVIDRNGRAILEVKYEDVGSLEGEFIYASLKDKYGYYDKSGKLRIPHMYEDVFDFKDGLAKVNFEGKEGVVDQFGAFYVSPAYESITHFADTMYLFEEGGLIGFMNNKCQIYKEPQFKQVGPLIDGFAVAELNETGAVVYLDRLGNTVIQNGLSAYPNFLLKGEFRYGLAIAMKDGKYGKIDTTGNFVIPAKYENIGLGNGMFPIQKNNLWGLMNNAAAVLLMPTYDALTVIDKRFVLATLRDTVGMIAPDGNILIPFTFKNIEPLMDDVFVAQADSGQVLFIGNTKVLPDHYERIGIYNEDYLYLVKGGMLSYFDITRKKKIEFNGRE
jgi:hypothetical protein